MAMVKITKEKLPDFAESEVNIYPNGDSSLPRIGVLKFERGTSKLTLDSGFLPYQSVQLVVVWYTAIVANVVSVERGRLAMQLTVNESDVGSNPTAPAPCEGSRKLKEYK